MDITYSMAKKLVSFTSKQKDDVHSYLLTNQRGDFIHQSLSPNVCKSFGFFYRDSNQRKPIKVIDWFGNLDLETKKVDIKEFQVQKEFSSPYVEDEHSYGFEKTTISPNGGCLIETQIEGSVVLDLDVKYFDDYSKFGKEYKIYEEEGVLFIEFLKKDEDSNETLKMYVGIKTPNLQYERVEEWIEKKYSYDKLRNLDETEFVFRAIRFDILNVHKKFSIGYSTNKEEVFEQLLLMDNFEEVIEKVEKGIDENGFGQTESQVPLSMQTQLSYDVSKRKLYDALIKDDQDNSPHIIAGFPWFYQEWVRDEVFSLRAFLEIGETQLVKEKLCGLCFKIDENGELPRLNIEGSRTSFDSVLLLAKRIEDFIFYVDENGLYERYVDTKTLELFYASLEKAFKGIMKNRWDTENELIKIEKEEWWRDTINRIENPLALQVSMINMISVMAILAKMLKKTVKCEEYLDLESTFKETIKEKYVRENQLFDEVKEDIVTCDVFLAYYIYPDLFEQKEWENFFSQALNHLYLNWGGISSLSKFDSNFQENYTGANDISYHRGDSWYFINAMTAMVLNHCNPKKFNKEIVEITQNLTNQVLFKGTFGHISEVSSAKSSESRGCPAQTWSNAFYLEMLHSIYKINTKK